MDWVCRWAVEETRTRIAETAIKTLLSMNKRVCFNHDEMAVDDKQNEELGEHDAALLSSPTRSIVFSVPCADALITNADKAEMFASYSDISMVIGVKNQQFLAVKNALEQSLAVTANVTSVLDALNNTAAMSAANILAIQGAITPTIEYIQSLSKATHDAIASVTKHAPGILDAM